MDKTQRIMIIRDSITKIAKILTDDKVMVTQAGVKAFVKYDEKTLKATRVNLPMIPDDASDELIEAIQGFLDSEISKVLYADGKSAIRSRYEDMDGIYKPIESIFCEKEMVKAFPGARSNLSNMHQTFVDRFIEPKLKKAISEGASEQELFQILAVPVLRAFGGQKFFQDYMDDKWSLIEGIKKELDPITSQLKGLKSGKDCYDTARQIRDVVMGEQTDNGGKGINSPAGDDRKSAGGQSQKSGKGKGKGKSGGKNAPSEGGSSANGDEADGSKGGGGGKEELEKPEDEGGSSTDADEKPEGGEDEADGKSGGSEAPEPEPEPEDEGSADEEEDGEDESTQEDDNGDAADEEDDALDENEEADEVDQEDDDGEKQDNSGGVNKDGFIDQSPRDSLEADEDVGQQEYGGAGYLQGFDWNKVQDVSDEFGQFVTDLCAGEVADDPYTVFTREWDTFEPPKVPTGYKPEWIDEMESKIKDMIGPVARSLERAFAARNKSLFQYGQTKGRLASNNLYRLTAGDDKIFKKKIEHKTREIAVSLVVDCSGSMGGSKIMTAMCAAWVMSEVLQRLGVDNEVIGFTTAYSSTSDKRYSELLNDLRDEYSKGRSYDRCEPIHMPVFKAFGERFGLEQKKRMASFPRVSGIMASNIDGESVQYAYERLLRHSTKGKAKGRMMIVFSDGMPAGGVPAGKLNAHLKRTVKNIEANNTNVVGIGIMSDSVREFYRKNVCLDNIEELPGLVLKQLRDSLLAS